jgi:hypothetical protein
VSDNGCDSGKLKFQPCETRTICTYASSYAGTEAFTGSRCGMLADGTDSISKGQV